MGRAGRWRLCACCMLCSPFMGLRDAAARQLGGASGAVDDGSPNWVLTVR